MKYSTRASLESVRRKTVTVPITWLDLCPEDEEGNPILKNDQGYDADTIVEHARLREMSGTSRDIFEISAFKSTKNGSGAATREINPKYLRAKLVTLCLIDDEGNRIYDDGEVSRCSDKLSASLLSKLFAAAQKLNGLDATVEDTAKNLPSEAEDDSHSDSPSPSEKPSLNS